LRATVRFQIYARIPLAHFARCLHSVNVKNIQEVIHSFSIVYHVALALCFASAVWNFSLKKYYLLLPVRNFFSFVIFF